MAGAKQDPALTRALRRAVSRYERDGEIDGAALTTLTEAGREGLEALTTQMRDQPDDATSLAPILAHWHGRGAAAELEPLTKDPDFDISTSSLLALGQLTRHQGVGTLEAFLLDPDEGFVLRSYAARALGQGRQAEAREALSKAITQAKSAIGDGDNAENLILAAAISLAQLGTHDAAPVVIELASSDEDVIRARALEALSHVVGPGTFDALKRGLDDPFDEAQLAAVDGLFYWGTVDAVDALMPVVESSAESVRARARTRLEDITDDEFEDPELTLDDCAAWWEENRSGYQRDQCYRLAELQHPEVIVKALKRKPNRRSDIIAEFTIVTGWSRPVGVAGKKLSDAMTSWARSHAKDFRPGVLYKYGTPLEKSTK